MSTCKFCNFPTKIVKELLDLKEISCPNCGDYLITGSAAASSIEKITDDDKMLFASHIRNNSIKGVIIKIDSSMLDKLTDIIASYKKIPLSEKIDLVIRYIAENSNAIGSPVDMNNTFTLFFLKREGELTTLLDWLDKMNLLKKYGGHSVILQADGWNRYEKLKEINVMSKKVFVAMNFKTELEYVYTDAIEPACIDCDFRAIRVDKIEHNQKICDKIIAEIRSSRFLIADFTDQRYGVYFEAGYAYGLGLPVIWTCKKGEESNLHFDTRQYNHIVWENPADLKDKLVNRIRATIK